MLNVERSFDMKPIDRICDWTASAKLWVKAWRNSSELR